MADVSFPTLLASGFFVVALLHTFAAHQVAKFSKRFPPGSLRAQIFHFLGEVEVIFGFWAFVYLLCLAGIYGTQFAVNYLEQVSFTEAAFVFVIMCMAATRPILQLAEQLLALPARIFGGETQLITYVSYLTLGPCLGSLITEPAAMTITALLLKRSFFDRSTNEIFKYASLGLLFVNISIGGTLTHFAAPPVVMVAEKWQWDSLFMLQNFGWKAVVAIVIGSLATAAVFKRELRALEVEDKPQIVSNPIPPWLQLSHVVFVAAVVLYHNSMAFFIPLFLIFLGWTEVTQKYQTPLKIRESLLVGFFLGGLITLGSQQGWWLQPLLQQLGDWPLYLGATALTAVTDNAALTYLGSLVPDLSTEARYLLMAGAVTGGGLTIVANAPNPAGYGILASSFSGGISPLRLFYGALPYTLLALVVFKFL